jgi:hypothetical protein
MTFWVWTHSVEIKDVLGLNTQCEIHNVSGLITECEVDDVSGLNTPCEIYLLPLKPLL